MRRHASAARCACCPERPETVRCSDTAPPLSAVNRQPASGSCRPLVVVPCGVLCLLSSCVSCASCGSCGSCAVVFFRGLLFFSPSLLVVVVCVSCRLACLDALGCVVLNCSCRSFLFSFLLSLSLWSSSPFVLFAIAGHCPSCFLLVCARAPVFCWFWC